MQAELSKHEKDLMRRALDKASSAAEADMAAKALIASLRKRGIDSYDFIPAECAAQEPATPAAENPDPFVEPKATPGPVPQPEPPEDPADDWFTYEWKSKLWLKVFGLAELNPEARTPYCFVKEQVLVYFLRILMVLAGIAVVGAFVCIALGIH